MSPSAAFLSPGVANALRLLQAKGRFPKGWTQELSQVGPKGGESIGQWFRNSVDQQCGGDVGQCSIEDTMAAFIGLGRQGNGISFCSSQVLVVTTSLDQFYRHRRGDCRYFRLDHDPRQLGELFREPLPHLHVVPHGAPRMMVPCHVSVNIVADMFDFLYRQFFYSQWQDWMRQVWDKERSKRLIPVAKDPLPLIEAAFQRNQLPELERHARHLLWLKQALRDAKDAAFPLRISGAHHELTAYW